jgi:thiosulfate reductase cytochrome b subunit
MSLLHERNLIRTLHLVLSIPIIGFIYGPVAAIPPAASFTRFVAVPLVILSGLWLWQKPRLLRWLRQRRIQND